MASWTLETLQRAVDEVTALVAIYGPDGCDPDAPTDAMVAETDALATAERVLALASSSSDDDVAAVAAVAAREVPALGVSVSFLGSRLRGAPVRVDATMPPGYPSKRAPSFDVRAAASASLEEISELRAAGESAMLDARGVEEEEEEEEDGAECVAPALDAIRARIEELDATLRRRAEDRETTTTTTTTTTTSTTSTTVSRRLLWFHHIKAKSKRKDAVAFARELDLGGFSKPGYPGVVVVEGRRENADEYVRRLRALRRVLSYTGPHTTPSAW